MYTEMKTKKEVKLMLVEAVRAYATVCISSAVTQEVAGDRFVSLKMDDASAKTKVLTLMQVLNIPEDVFDELIDSTINCDRCGDPVLAYLTHVGLEETVLCEDCKIEEDPLTAMHETLQHNWDMAEYGEVMDHRTDHDGITESFPTVVKLDA